jgi:uncharacterized OB-fold protein
MNRRMKASSWATRLSIEDFYIHFNKGELIGLKCDLGHLTLPPQPRCKECGSESLNPIKMSGRGKVISFSQVFVSLDSFAKDTPYFLVFVNLEEGGCLLGILKNLRKGEEPRYGLRVKAKPEKKKENTNGKDWPNWPRIAFVPI